MRHISDTPRYVPKIQMRPGPRQASSQSGSEGSAGPVLLPGSAGPGLLPRRRDLREAGRDRHLQRADQHDHARLRQVTRFLPAPRVPERRAAPGGHGRRPDMIIRTLRNRRLQRRPVDHQTPCFRAPTSRSACSSSAAAAGSSRRAGGEIAGYQHADRITRTHLQHPRRPAHPHRRRPAPTRPPRRPRPHQVTRPEHTKLINSGWSCRLAASRRVGLAGQTLPLRPLKGARSSALCG